MCDVYSVGCFGITSIILDKYESRTILNIPDINAHFDKLNRDGFLSKIVAEVRRQRTRELYPDAKVLSPYYNGSTYISLEDAI